MHIEKLLKGEIIGKCVTITKCKNGKNKLNNSLEGEIVDETKNTVVIETEKGEKKKVVKEECVFVFSDSDNLESNEAKSIGTIKVNGNLLVGRSEDRIKSKVKSVKNGKKN